MKISKNKADLETEKLQLEIDSLKKKGWKKLLSKDSPLPAIAILLTIAVSIFSGFFNNERKVLELQKENLKKEILIFDSTKSRLEQLIVQLKETTDSLEKINSHLVIEVDNKPKGIFLDKPFLVKSYKNKRETEYSLQAKIIRLNLELENQKRNLTARSLERNFFRDKLKLYYALSNDDSLAYKEVVKKGNAGLNLSITPELDEKKNKLTAEINYVLSVGGGQIKNYLDSVYNADYNNLHPIKKTSTDKLFN
jgi:hypothetical protein